MFTPNQQNQNIFTKLSQEEQMIQNKLAYEWKHIYRALVQSAAESESNQASDLIEVKAFD